MVEWARKKMDSGLNGSSFVTPEFDGSSEILADIKAGARSWRALDIIYNFKNGIDEHANYWVNMLNAQAVRNRLLQSKILLKQALLLREKNTGRGTESNPLYLVSLAAGSAQGVLEIVAELRQEQTFVDVLLIDDDYEVSNLIERRVKSLELSSCVEFVAKKALKFQHLCKQPPDVIEMLGLLDYLPRKLAVRHCTRIFETLDRGGYFLTCHIHENLEMDFLQYVINWGHKPYMYYRSKEELRKIVSDAGFRKPILFTEPHQIHSIAVGQKGTATEST